MYIVALLLFHGCALSSMLWGTSHTPPPCLQALFLSHVCSDTLLVGHALDNDLRVLRVLHSRVLDTSIMYPHPRGPPYKSALKVRGCNCQHASVCVYVCMPCQHTCARTLVTCHMHGSVLDGDCVDSGLQSGSYQSALPLQLPPARAPDTQPIASS